MRLLDASDSAPILGWQYQVRSVTAHLRLLNETIHTAMKINLSLSAPALVCLALASCYPIDNTDPRNPRGPEKKEATEETVSSSSQQKVQEQRDRMKEKQETKKREVTSVPKEKPKTETTAATTKPKADYSFANPVPGKEGFVFSPYNNKLVDVRDIPSGTLVQDPTYPASEKKYFRVP